VTRRWRRLPPVPARARTGCSHPRGTPHCTVAGGLATQVLPALRAGAMQPRRLREGREVFGNQAHDSRPFAKRMREATMALPGPETHRSKCRTNLEWSGFQGGRAQALRGPARRAQCVRRFVVVRLLGCMCANPSSRATSNNECKTHQAKHLALRRLSGAAAVKGAVPPSKRPLGRSYRAGAPASSLWRRAPVLPFSYGSS
jgi:hypothetical protein